MYRCFGKHIFYILTESICYLSIWPKRSQAIGVVRTTKALLPASTALPVTVLRGRVEFLPSVKLTGRKLLVFVVVPSTSTFSGASVSGSLSHPLTLRLGACQGLLWQEQLLVLAHLKTF